MNKTLNINLSGHMFHVDEDAYKLLYDYLYNLRHAFERQEGGNEIMDDLESRLSELLLERISDRQEVVSRNIVEETIARLGRPEEITGEDGNTQEATETEQPTTEETADTSNKNTETADAQTEEEKTEVPPPPPLSHKRLYRDPDNRILGGVLGGLALYLNWDPTLLRLLLVVVLIAGYGIIIPIYLICWLVIPKATTAADKLCMHGKPVTMENIGKMVTNGIDNVNEYIRSDKPRTAFQRFTDRLVSFIGIVLKVLLVVLGICCAPFLLMLLVVFFVLIIALISLLVGSTTLWPHYAINALSLNPDIGPWGLVCSISFVLGAILLVVCFVSGIFSLIFQWKGFSQHSLKVMLFTSLICLIVSGVALLLSGWHLLTDISMYQLDLI